MGRAGHSDLLVGTQEAVVVPDHVSDFMGKEEGQGMVILARQLHRPSGDHDNATRHCLDQDLRRIEDVDLEDRPGALAGDPEEPGEDPFYPLGERVHSGKHPILLSLDA